MKGGEEQGSTMGREWEPVGEEYITSITEVSFQRLDGLILHSRRRRRRRRVHGNGRKKKVQRKGRAIGGEGYRGKCRRTVIGGGRYRKGSGKRILQTDGVVEEEEEAGKWEARALRQVGAGAGDVARPRVCWLGRAVNYLWFGRRTLNCQNNNTGGIPRLVSGFRSLEAPAASAKT